MSPLTRPHPPPEKIYDENRGLFWAGNLGLANRPLHLPAQTTGRYHLYDHIIALELDAGPVLIGFAGKMLGADGIERLFVGGNSFKAVKDAP